MHLRNGVIIAIVLVVFLSIGGAAWWAYQSSVKYTDMTFYAWMTNPTSKPLPLNYSHFSIDVTFGNPLSLNGTNPKGNNTTFNVEPNGKQVDGTITTLGPGQTIVVEIAGIPTSHPLESKQFNQSLT
jgi:hypothetical protein